MEEASDGRFDVLARAIDDAGWRPAVDCEEAAALRALEASGWVELKVKRKRYLITVTSEGILRHYLWSDG